MLGGVNSSSLFGFLKDTQSSSLQQLFKDTALGTEAPLEQEAAGESWGWGSWVTQLSAHVGHDRHFTTFLNHLISFC